MDAGFLELLDSKVTMLTWVQTVASTEISNIAVASVACALVHWGIFRPICDNALPVSTDSG